MLTADLTREESYVPKELLTPNPNHPFRDILQQFENHVQNSFATTLRNITPKQLKILEQWIVQSQRIMVYGVGSSLVVSQDVYQKFLGLGFTVSRPNDFHMAATTLGHFNPKDLVVLISLSGHPSEILEIADMARNRNINIFSITEFMPRNPLGHKSSLTLYIHSLMPSPGHASDPALVISIGVVEFLFLYLHRNR